MGGEWVGGRIFSPFFSFSGDFFWEGWGLEGRFFPLSGDFFFFLTTWSLFSFFNTLSTVSFSQQLFPLKPENS